MQERPIATEIIKEKMNTIKLLLIVIVIQSLLLAGVSLKVLDFFSGYTFESSVEVSTDGDGTAIYQNGEGNNLNVGKGESKKNNETEGKK